MDDDQMHKIDSIKQIIWDWNTKLKMIPVRQAGYFKPLYISIYK